MRLSLNCGLRAGLLLAALFTGCTAKHYRHSADREAYGIIQQKTPVVRNMDQAFSIEQTNVASLDHLRVTTNVADFLGPDAELERGARIMTLEDALLTAKQLSRRYQSEKESLYLSALSLALARHDFAPIFSSTADAQYMADRLADDGASDTSDGLIERKIDSGASLGASWLIRDVGKLTTAISADFVRFVSGDRSVVSSSRFAATFTRPLLRNAAFKSEMEALTLAERTMVYDLRDFTQFRKDFSVQVATAYYGVLGRRDAVRNSFLNLTSSRKNAERSRALAQEGRITQSDLGRLEQQELSAEGSWITALRSYKQDLDNFKLLLGLNVDTHLVLDDRELTALQILEPKLTVDESIAVALEGRFDLLNLKDKLADAGRNVAVKRNLLYPKLDFDAGVSLASDPAESGHLSWPDPSRYAWNAGLALDPGLDRKAERNSYMSALIGQRQAERAVVQQEDQIKVDVRDSWRTLDQARRSFEISDIGVKLAERRVEEQNLLAELGRAKAQDQVDAENALIDSRNQRTQALVTHTIARLQFWNRLGILYIKDNGQWEETQDAKAK